MDGMKRIGDILLVRRDWTRKDILVMRMYHCSWLDIGAILWVGWGVTYSKYFHTYTFPFLLQATAYPSTNHFLQLLGKEQYFITKTYRFSIRADCHAMNGRIIIRTLFITHLWLLRNFQSLKPTISTRKRPATISHTRTNPPSSTIIISFYNSVSSWSSLLG